MDPFSGGERVSHSTPMLLKRQKKKIHIIINLPVSTILTRLMHSCHVNRVVIDMHINNLLIFIRL